jgi:hypothetical protein
MKQYTNTDNGDLTISSKSVNITIDKTMINNELSCETCLKNAQDALREQREEHNKKIQFFLREMKKKQTKQREEYEKASEKQQELIGHLTLEREDIIKELERPDTNLDNLISKLKDKT